LEEDMDDNISMKHMKNTQLYILAGSLSHYARSWGASVSETLAKEIAQEHRDSEWMDFEEFCRFHRVDSKALLAEIA
jgi:Ca2+-binding EF-hand superfamily protein